MKKNLLITALVVLMSMVGNVYAQYSFSSTAIYANEDNTPLPYVTVELYDSNHNLLQTTITDANGNYTFENLSDQEYIITGSYDLETNAVDVVDPVLILAASFNDGADLQPMQKKAADVDGDDQVTLGDYFDACYALVWDDFEFPAGEWQFEEVSIFPGLRASSDDVPRGTASGDVNTTWDPDVCTIAKCNSEEYNYNAGDMIDVEVKINPVVLSGYKFEMTYDVEILENVTISQVALPQASFDYVIENGTIRVVSIADEVAYSEEVNVLFNVQGTLTEEFDGEFGFNVLSNTHVGTENNQVIKASDKSLNITVPVIKAEEVITNGIEMSVFPNPANGESVNFTYTAPANGKMNVTLINTLGQVVLEIENSSMAEGTYSKVLNVEDLPAGVYLYKVDFNGVGTYTKTERIIIE